MLYRALNIISTQRFRMPVRRYILDLFDYSLDVDTVAAITLAGKELHASRPTNESPKAPNRVSMFGRLARPRRASESDGEDDGLDDYRVPVVTARRKPVVSLRPMSRIVGFEDLVAAK